MSPDMCSYGIYRLSNRPLDGCRVPQHPWCVVLVVNRFVVSVIVARNGPNKINVRSDSCADLRTRAPGQLEVKESSMDHADSGMKPPVNEAISATAPVATTAP